MSERPTVWRQPAEPAYDQYRWEERLTSALLMGNLREIMLRAVAEGVPDDAQMVYAGDSVCFFWKRVAQ